MIINFITRATSKYHENYLFAMEMDFIPSYLDRMVIDDKEYQVVEVSHKFENGKKIRTLCSLYPQD